MSELKDRVERIERLYIQTQHVIEKAAHSCTFDALGRCKFCPKRAEK